MTSRTLLGRGHLVHEGWNRASYHYRPEDSRSDVFGHDTAQYLGWLQPVLQNVPRRSRVLDLGCGCGVPTAQALAEPFRVTGVDLSEVQLERARRLVPNASFLLKDMTEVDFPDRSFSAVVCLYALIHVPLTAQRPLLERIHRWLVRGGWLILIAGHEAYEGTEENWLGCGASMFWSHADASTYRAWLEELGFAIRKQAYVPEGTGGHELFQCVAL